MSKTNGKDKAMMRAELTRRLMQLAPKARLDALLEGADGAGLVRSVPAEDLYSTILDVGLVDATEVVQLASPHQFRTFIDLAAWTRDRIDPLEVLAWLRAARSDDDDAFMAKVRGLDLEVIELVLRALVVVHDLEENPDVNPSGPTMEMPEGRYLLEFLAEGSDLATLRALIADFLAENAFEFARLLEAVRWELLTELEEVAHRFRAGRLADLGFPPLDEALALFTYVDPDLHAPPAPSLRPEPGTLAAGKGHLDFVEAAFRGLDEGEREKVAEEVRYLVNSALVAEAAEPGDPRALRRVSELARDYLSLALEHLTRGAPDAAADRVREFPLKKLFQLGFSLTLQLKFRVDRLAREPLARIEGTWLLLDDEAAAISALSKKRPLRALKVEGADPVPFRNRRELLESQALIDRAEAELRVLRAVFGGGLDEARAVVARFGLPLSDLTPERVWTSAVAHAVLDGVAEPRPVAPGRLAELGERLFEAEGPTATLRSSAGERARKALASVLPSDEAVAGLMVDRALDQLLAELGPAHLNRTPVDPTRLLALPVALS